MKTLVPTSTWPDSAALLYYLLRKTDDDVTSILFSKEQETKSTELIVYPKMCEWLVKNARPFDYSIKNDTIVGSGRVEKISSKYDMIGHYATILGVDRICMGYNTFNWNTTNWFFSCNDPIDSRYNGNTKSEFSALMADDNSHQLKTFSGTVEWPFMSRNGKVMGRWEIWESIPKELQDLTSKCLCGNCLKCNAKRLYRKLKAEGMTAKEIDDEIMKRGKYGKYYEEGSTRNTFNDALK